MAAIEQIYGTHCSYGSSAIERRDGDTASRVLGYSARASSLAQEELRRQYRIIERYLYYYLPSDSPPERKLELTADNAPRRLLYHPSIGGVQVLLHVAYRQWDVNHQSPGAYFAHALLQPREADVPPWSLIDCLRLWQAPGWRLEDAASIPHDLPALNTLSDLLRHSEDSASFAAENARIDDELLKSFLHDSQWHPHSVCINERWRNMPQSERLRMFRTAFAGFLDIFSSPRDSALLVIEPDIAALFFYGIARLLPERMRSTLSFSTYETHPDQLTTRLAAIVFENATTDVKPDRYQKGFVLNTFFDNRCTQLRKSENAYVSFILDSLKDAAEWSEIDDLLGSFDQAGAESVEHLEELVRAHNVGSRILDPSSSFKRSELSSTTQVGNLVRSMVENEFQGQPSDEKLGALANSPEHLFLVLEMIAGNRPLASCEHASSVLLDRIPSEDFAEFLRLKQVSESYKAKALANYLRKRSKLPPQCDELWNALKDNRWQGSLLLDALRQIEVPQLEAIVRTNNSRPAPPADLVFLHLLLAIGNRQGGDHTLTTLARTFDLPTISSTVQRLGSRVDKLSKAVKAAFCKKAIRRLDEVHRFPEQIKDNLKWLKSVRSLLNADDANRLDSWEAIVNSLESKARQFGSESRSLVKKRGHNPEAFGQELANNLRVAMPHKMQPDPLSPDERAVYLKNIAEHFKCGELLPDHFEQGITTCMSLGSWKTLNANRNAKGGEDIKQLIIVSRKKIGSFLLSTTGIGTCLAAVFAVVVIFGAMRILPMIRQQPSSPAQLPLPKSNATMQPGGSPNKAGPATTSSASSVSSKKGTTPAKTSNDDKKTKPLAADVHTAPAVAPTASKTQNSATKSLILKEPIAAAPKSAVAADLQKQSESQPAVAESQPAQPQDASPPVSIPISEPPPSTAIATLPVPEVAVQPHPVRELPTSQRAMPRVEAKLPSEDFPKRNRTTVLISDATGMSLTKLIGLGVGDFFTFHENNETTLVLRKTGASDDIARFSIDKDKLKYIVSLERDSKDMETVLNSLRHSILQVRTSNGEPLYISLQTINAQNRAVRLHVSDGKVIVPLTEHKLPLAPQLCVGAGHYLNAEGILLDVDHLNQYAPNRLRIGDEDLQLMASDSLGEVDKKIKELKKDIEGLDEYVAKCKAYHDDKKSRKDYDDIDKMAKRMRYKYGEKNTYPEFEKEKAVAQSLKMFEALKTKCTSTLVRLNNTPPYIEAAMFRVITSDEVEILVPLIDSPEPIVKDSPEPPVK